MIEPLDVLKKLASLNSWKAPGIDGVCNRLLKQCAASLAGPLCHVFNTSLEEGKFPDKWKNAVIQPILKQKGFRDNPKNCRPIALLPCMTKIFEHFVHQQLLEYCLACDAIPDDRYGFLPGRSTTWQLLTVLDEWKRHLDHGNGIHACFLDIAKAFDRVEHPSLLNKLDSLGIRDKEKAWFKSYLFDRSICTRVECAQSQPQPISSGVPQGSVLGPLLFVIFLRDLPDVISSRSALFADGTLMFDLCNGKTSSPCCRIPADLDSVQKWAVDWSTTFNAGKSTVMNIRSHRKHQLTPSSMQAVQSSSLGTIPIAEKTRHLGVILTDSLTWSPHVRDILKRVGYTAFILKRLAYRCRADGFVRHMFMTVVRPILEYASPVWDSCTKAEALALERLQLSVARAIVKKGRRVASNSAVLEMIGWPTLAWRRRRLKLVLLWKLMHGHGPPALRAQLPTCVSVRAKQSLRRDTLAMPLCRTQRRLQSFLPSTVALWNSLPSSVLSCISLSSFLVSLDSHLISDRYSLGL